MTEEKKKVKFDLLNEYEYELTDEERMKKKQYARLVMIKLERKRKERKKSSLSKERLDDD